MWTVLSAGKRCQRLLLYDAGMDLSSIDMWPMTLPSFQTASAGGSLGRGAERSVLVEPFLVDGQAMPMTSWYDLWIPNIPTWSIDLTFPNQFVSVYFPTILAQHRGCPRRRTVDSIGYRIGLKSRRTHTTAFTCVSR